MSYAAAIEALHSLAGELVSKPGAPRKKFRLEEMRTLLDGLGNPERSFPSVLIAGTNGKGSTAATLASILAEAGYRVGLYTSPHLGRVNERVRILERSQQVTGRIEAASNHASAADGEISDDVFAALYFRVDEAACRLVREGGLADYPSFFEAMTALAFLQFAESKIDIAVLEVGMGGRLDATNVVEPLLSVITDISLDHTEWLGPTIDAIAREKAGILRPNGTMITLPQHREANEALGEVAVGLGVRGVNAADYIPAPGTAQESGRSRYRIQVMGEVIEIDSPLAGHHQQRNIALAIAAAVELSNSHGYKIKPADIARGVSETRWPGRLELFAGKGTRADVLLDVAHNPAGAWVLRSGVSALLEQQPGKSSTLLFGCLRDKAIADMEQILFPLFDRVVVAPVDSPRSASREELLAAAASTGVAVQAAANAEQGLVQAFEATPADGLVVVAGSVYLVGAVRGVLTMEGVRR
jgi:dihydrofolate synthase / folylpolyglutamate synthase